MSRRLPGWRKRRPPEGDDDLDDELRWRVRAWRDPDEAPKQYLDLERVDLVGEDFNGRRLDQLYVDASHFRHCRFERMVVESAVLGSPHSGKTCLYEDCSFDGSRLTMTSYGYARFERCSFRDVRISDWICFSLELIDCDFAGARLERCVFNGEVPRKEARRLKRARNEFHGNDFSRADLLDVDFRTGIDLTLQKLPRGPDYFYVSDLEAAVRIGRAHIAEFEDPDVKENMAIFLDLAEADLKDGQRQALLRAEDIPAGDRGGIIALIELWSSELT